MHCRPQDGDGVDAAVLFKAVVLHRDHRVQIKLGQLVDGGVAGGRPDGGKGGFQALAVQGLAVHPVALEGQQAAGGQDKGERQPEQAAQKFE